MLKFYNREAELEALRRIRIASKKSASFTYIIGPRRIGKTFLVEHWLNQLPAKQLWIYLFTERKTMTALLDEWREILAERLEFVPNFKNWDDFFGFVFDLSSRQALTLVIDEFQNFVYVDKAVFFILQKHWDKSHGNSKINLITIGSVYTTMQKIFADKHEPLYGRTTNQMEVRGLELPVLWQILVDYKAGKFGNLLNWFTLFGGVPKYYALLARDKLFGKSIYRAFERLFLFPEAPLAQEGRNVLIQEFGPDYQTYFSILEAIASLPSPTNQKIASYVGVELNHLGSYLKNLEVKFYLISRQVPVVNPRGKVGVYQIKSDFLSIWFKYIFAYRSWLESRQTGLVLDYFRDNIRVDQGRVFEKLVGLLLRSDYRRYPYVEWGKYWDSEVEVDVVGVDRRAKKVLLVECKLAAFKVNQDLVGLIDRQAEYMAGLLPGYEVRRLLAVAESADKVRVSLPKDMEVLGEKELVELMKI
jgi:hypothetical protein